MHVANPITDEHNAQKEGVVAQSDVDLSNFEWCIRRCQKIKKNKKIFFRVNSHQMQPLAKK